MVQYEKGGEGVCGEAREWGLEKAGDFLSALNYSTALTSLCSVWSIKRVDDDYIIIVI